MTEDESIEEVVFMKGLFPMTTQEQARYWRDKFVQFDKKHVRRAIERFADKHSEFVDRAGLLDLIGVEERRGVPPVNPQIERSRIDEHWRSVDAAIDAMPPPDRERLCDEVIASLPDKLREMVRPRRLSSKLVKASVYERIKSARW